MDENVVEQIAEVLDTHPDNVTVEVRARGRTTVVLHEDHERVVVGEVPVMAELPAFIAGLRSGVRFR